MSEEVPFAILLGVKTHIISLTQLLYKINNFVNKEKCAPFLINYVNAHAINLAQKDIEFKDVLNKSNIVFCDGFGVKIALKLLFGKTGERMTPPDWIDRLLEICIEQNKRVFFLGDEEEVIIKFVNKIAIKYPNLIIAGYNNGFFPKTPQGDREIIQKINDNNTDILIIGMGMPIQEKWAYNNRNDLFVKVIISVGALFRWYSGHERRGPKWLTDIGLEWLFRLLVQPSKVWKRYVLGLPLFILRVFFAIIGLSSPQWAKKEEN